MSATEHAGIEGAFGSCADALRTHSCSTWPPQALADSVSKVMNDDIKRVVSAIMDKFPQGVEYNSLASLMQLPCMQRICVHVQLIDGKMYVIAPEDMQTCMRGGSLQTRLSCPPSTHSWSEDRVAECDAALRDRSIVQSDVCTARARMRQPGVSIPRFFSEWHYPHTLEWNFAAGLNLSSCRATGPRVPLPGDHNHVFSRLRLQSALRLLMRAYERLHSLGRLTQPLELIVCPNETPVNLGDWCARGAQPIFSSTTNEDTALIPFVQWIQAPERDADLAHWSPPESRINATRWGMKAPKVVFRGSVQRLSVYSDRWRQQRPRRTQVTSDNWRSVGRTALLAAKLRRPDLFNIRLSPRSVEAREGLQARLAISNITWGHMDGGTYLTMQEQSARYKYAADVEGHGGWADRGYKLLLQEQLVFVQDMPARPWYYLFMRPFEHYVPIDSNLDNLTQAIVWAIKHDARVQQIVEKANARASEVLQPRTMFRYTEATLEGYARLFKYVPKLHHRAIRFLCDELHSSSRSCLRKGTDRHHLGETRCYFEAPPNSGTSGPRLKANTLYEASLRLPTDNSLFMDQAQHQKHSPFVVQAMQRGGGHRQPLGSVA
jgi:hypothetical protein